MKRKAIINWCLAAIIVGLTIAAIYHWIFVDPFFAKYEQIREGMTREEVEALLGQGTEITQDHIPTRVVAINPADEVASAERSRKAGTIPTARDYPVQQKPVVEEDLFLIWHGPVNDAKIYVGFKNQRVSGKYLFEIDL